MEQTEQTEQTEQPAADEIWSIEVEHSQYYRQLPVPEADLIPVMEAADPPDPDDPSQDNPNPNPNPDTPPVQIGWDYNGKILPMDWVVDSTFPGYKMVRTVIDEPTTTTTSVIVSSLGLINEDRLAAGLGRKSQHANLLRHLEDGPWPKHFPLESITAIRCSHPGMEAKLLDYFGDTA